MPGGFIDRHARKARPFGRFSNHWIVIRSTRGWVDLFGEIKSKNRVTQPQDRGLKVTPRQQSRTVLVRLSTLQSTPIQKAQAPIKQVTDSPRLKALTIYGIRSPKL